MSPKNVVTNRAIIQLETSSGVWSTERVLFEEQPEHQGWRHEVKEDMTAAWGIIRWWRRAFACPVHAHHAWQVKGTSRPTARRPTRQLLNQHALLWRNRVFFLLYTSTSYIGHRFGVWVKFNHNWSATCLIKRNTSSGGCHVFLIPYKLSPFVPIGTPIRICFGQQKSWRNPINRTFVYRT